MMSMEAIEMDGRWKESTRVSYIERIFWVQLDFDKCNVLEERLTQTTSRRQSSVCAGLFVDGDGELPMVLPLDDGRRLNQS